jgi:dihydrofolate synthase/folylpolyglutamate synthase
VIITTPGTFKVSEPEKVYGIFTRALQAEGAEPGSVVFIKETEKAVRYVLEQSREQGLPVLGVGSFYLAAEIRALAVSRSGGRRKSDEKLGTGGGC